MKHWTIAADPPWNERGAGKIKRGADRHYPLLRTNEDIHRVMTTAEVWPDFGPGDTASLWMWATANYLDDAIRLMGMLGFEYVTNKVWVKAHEINAQGSMAGTLICPQPPGLGQRQRMCHEHLLYGRWGKVPSPPPESRAPSVVYAPRSEHSEKPDEAYAHIMTHEDGVVQVLTQRALDFNSLVANDDVDHECIELFARRPRDGWTVWGNEVD